MIKRLVDLFNGLKPVAIKNFDILKQAMINSRKSIKNFVLFALCVGLITFPLRIFFFSYASDSVISLNVLQNIGFIALLSTTISIILFTVRYLYTNRLIELVSGFVDLGPIKENSLKWENLENEAKKQFPNILFSLRFLYIPFIFGLLLIIHFKKEGFLTNSMLFLFVVFTLFYFFYLRKIRNAIVMVSLSPSMEPVPPKYLKLWWHFTFIIWTTTQELIFGKSRLTADELQYMVLKNRNRYWRIGMFTAFCGSIVTTEMWLYSGSIYTSPSTRVKNLLLSGYYSPLNSTLEMAWALETRGCRMESFCYPNSQKLDPSAVQEAHDYIEDLRNNGKSPGKDAPLPQGRYLPILISGIDGTSDSFLRQPAKELIQESKKLVEVKEIDLN